MFELNIVIIEKQINVYRNKRKFVKDIEYQDFLFVIIYNFRGEALKEIFNFRRKEDK